MNKLCLKALLMVLTIGIAMTEVAAEQRAVYLDEHAGVCEILFALSPSIPAHCLVGDKSVVINTPAPVAAAPAPAPAPRQQYAFATRIQFEFDSYRLTTPARRQLDEIALALTEPVMTNKVVLIEGHADSTGAAAYNLTLSQQRAAAVMRYLHERHGIPTWRLRVAGKGEAEPYDRRNPYAAINRRVEFINVTDSRA